MSLAIYSQSDSGSSQFSSEVNSGHLDEHTHDYHIYNYDIEDGEVLHEYSQGRPRRGAATGHPLEVTRWRVDQASAAGHGQQTSLGRPRLGAATGNSVEGRSGASQQHCCQGQHGKLY